MNVKCTACQAACSISEQLAGKKVRCPKCKAVFVAAAVQALPVAQPVAQPEEPITLETVNGESDGLRSGAPNPKPPRRADEPMARVPGVRKPAASLSTPWLWLAGGAIAVVSLCAGITGATLIFWMSGRPVGDVAKIDPIAPADLPGGPAKGNPNADPNGDPRLVPAAGVDFPPPPRDLKPAPLTEEREVRTLPSAIGASCCGGSGRYLIMHLPRERKLAVFDANEAKIVTYLPAADDNCLLAAGSDKLFVAMPGNNLIQRWSLKTFEKELTVNAPAAIGELATGSGSRGPIFARTGQRAGDRFGGQVFCIDPQSLKQMDVKFAPAGGGGRGDPGRQESGLRVSTNGELLTGQGVYQRLGNVFKGVAGAPSNPYPGADGRFFYISSQIYTAAGGTIGKDTGHTHNYFPALHGHYFLDLAQVETGGRFSGFRLDIHLADDPRPLVNLGELHELDDLQEYPGGGHPPFDRHVLFIPEAHLLITIPRSKDKLHLRRVNIDKLLDASGVDYLFVQSLPPATVGKGQAYRYPIVVRSKRGGVKFSLDSAPPNMKVSPQGVVTWTPPQNFAEAEASVIVSVRDDSGQEVFHTFRIGVTP